MTLLEWAMLLALSAFWASAFFFNGVAMRELPTLTIVALRLGVASAILCIVMYVIGLRLPMNRQALTQYLGMGLLNNCLPLSLILWGQAHIGSALASILNATTPLAAILLTHVFTLDEKISVKKLVGAALGFAGVVFLIGPAYLSGLRTDFIAQLACLAAAFSYASAGVYARAFGTKGGSPLAAATGQVLASTLLIGPAAMVLEEPWTLSFPDVTTWSAIAGIAIFSTALSYILYFRILSTAGTTNLMLVAFLIPVNVVVSNVIFYGIWLEPRYYTGVLLIAAGLAAIDGRVFTYVMKGVSWLRNGGERRARQRPT
jgi:drug/metabolite transporter (DMT)-like permease